MKLEPFSTTFGTILHGTSRSLLELDRALVAAHVRTTGMVLLRGFDPTEEEFARWSDGFGTAYVAHLGGIRGSEVASLVPERGPVSIAGQVQDGIHTATLGQQGINPHSEASYSPMCPDLLWFYCRVPNARGEGRTGFCDGIDLLRSLSPAARDELTAATIRWHVRVPRAYLEEQLRSRFEDLAARWLDGRPDCRYTLHPDASIEVEYVAPAVRRTRFGDEPAFCNSLLSRMPFRVVEMTDLRRFVPGMSRESIEEAMALAHGKMHYLDWEVGDIAFVDNSRVMHAREAFTDARRTLWVVTMMASAPLWKA